jgi:hypothetical protein
MTAFLATQCRKEKIKPASPFVVIRSTDSQNVDYILSQMSEAHRGNPHDNISDDEDDSSIPSLDSSPRNVTMAAEIIRLEQLRDELLNAQEQVEEIEEDAMDITAMDIVVEEEEEDDAPEEAVEEAVEEAPEEAVVAAPVIARRPRRPRPAEVIPAGIQQPRQANGKFAARADAPPNAKRARNDAPYRKAAAWLLEVRYAVQEDEEEPEMPPDFDATDVTGDVDACAAYLNQTMININFCRKTTIKLFLQQGKTIEEFCKKKKRENKRLSKKAIYAMLGGAMEMRGNEESNSRWFQMRQALAKIEDLLELENFSYSTSPSELMRLAPQLAQAVKLGLFPTIEE